MWQCDNCGYTDEDGSTFEEETEESLEDAVHFCPECGSDEVFQVDDEKDLQGAAERDGGDDPDGDSDDNSDHN